MGGNKVEYVSPFMIQTLECGGGRKGRKEERERDRWWGSEREGQVEDAPELPG